MSPSRSARTPAFRTGRRSRRAPSRRGSTTHTFKVKGYITASLALKSIDTVGKWTVDLHLSAPNSEMPYMLSEANMWGFIGSPKAIAHASTLGTGTDGAGPYIAVPSQSIPGSTYVFKPDPYYYDQSAVHFSKVVVKIITSPTTMIEAIKSGQ